MHIVKQYLSWIWGKIYYLDRYYFSILIIFLQIIFIYKYMYVCVYVCMHLRPFIIIYRIYFCGETLCRSPVGFCEPQCYRGPLSLFPGFPHRCSDEAAVSLNLPEIWRLHLSRWVFSLLFLSLPEVASVRAAGSSLSRSCFYPWVRQRPGNSSQSGHPSVPVLEPASATSSATDMDTASIIYPQYSP